MHSRLTGTRTHTFAQELRVREFIDGSAEGTCRYAKRHLYVCCSGGAGGCGVARRHGHGLVYIGPRVTYLCLALSHSISLDFSFFLCLLSSLFSILSVASRALFSLLSSICLSLSYSIPYSLFSLLSSIFYLLFPPFTLPFLSVSHSDTLFPIPSSFVSHLSSISYLLFSLFTLPSSGPSLSHSLSHSSVPSYSSLFRLSRCHALFLLHSHSFVLSRTPPSSRPLIRPLSLSQSVPRHDTQGLETR